MKTNKPETKGTGFKRITVLELIQKLEAIEDKSIPVIVAPKKYHNPDINFLQVDDVFETAIDLDQGILENEVLLNCLLIKGA